MIDTFTSYSSGINRLESQNASDLAGRSGGIGHKRVGIELQVSTGRHAPEDSPSPAVNVVPVVDKLADLYEALAVGRDDGEGLRRFRRGPWSCLSGGCRAPVPELISTARP